MSGNGPCFVEWKEQFVSQERGNRVVHYFLKDSNGESTLAVVGTERSVRHMFYVIAEEFLEVYGKESSSIHAGFKWRSRREVVDWLTSMLSKQHNLHGDRSESPTHDSTQALQFPEYPINGINHNHASEGKGRFAKNFKGHGSDIVWSGSPWACGKQLKHYPAFCRNGITVSIHSFVFVMAKGANHYIAYLEDMYEDKRGQKKVKVRWFHRNQEVKGVIPIRNPHPKEVFITPYAQVISAECVDGLATVLTREHYEKCEAAIPQAFLVKVHMCYRQFKSNRTKSFDLSKLRGYFDQPILSCLGPDFFLQSESLEETDDISNGENAKVGTKKRTRSSTDHSRAKKSSKNRGTIRDGLFSLKHLRSQPWLTQLFKVDDKIELLCQDSGIRGCWFRCTVLQISKKQIKVQYDDLQDEDGSGNLEEWIPSFKLAMPDKLGMRHSGRPTIRPTPIKEQTELSLEIGAAIDAWWSDGWWEGVITGLGSCGDYVQIFFPGESLVLNLHKKDLRTSRDWLGDKWINIETKPDIVSAISIVSSSGSRPSTSSTIHKDINSGGLASTFEDPSSTKCIIPEEENQNLNLTTSTSSDDPPKDMDCVDCEIEKSPSLRDNDGVEVDNGCDNADSSKGEDGNVNGNDNSNNDDGKVDTKEHETSEQKSSKEVETMEVAG
uniref:BAH domain-containing protein n=1 Tax=Cannabis sativa TaxID=3483 RepID=A0A803Q7R1_CANSA